jgi:peptidyl-prolyl cis-trans isomerase B (cyclophilin B)
MQAVTEAIVLFSVLFPTKIWYAPGQPITVGVRGDAAVTLVLTDFLGKVIDPVLPAEVASGGSADVREIYPQVLVPGTYLLYAVPRGSALSEFVGTPLVIGVRRDERRDSPPGAMVTRVSPLCHAQLTTSHGDMKMAFYYDVAPNTVASFLDLAEGGFYDDLVFHRVVAGFLIQSGDPVGADPARGGTGGPGFQITAEFNDRPHVPGVVSMARETDPLERQGALPRPTIADSAGSQFFICLDYKRTRQLDRKYTAFGRVYDGLEVAQKIGQVQTDPVSERPLEPVQLKQIRILPVDASNNPYPKLIASQTGAPGVGELINRP